MKKIFLKGIIFSLGFSITLGMFIFSYAAWVSLSTQSNGTTITETIWNDVINKINTIGAKVDTLSNIPTGAVMAFNLSTCPTGWIPADGTNSTPDLRGEFIRGFDNGRGIDSGRVLGSSQNGTQLPNLYTHRATSTAGVLVSPPISEYGGDNVGISASDFESSKSGSGPYYSVNLTPSGSVGLIYFRVRPRNVALLYCVKQ